MKSNAFEEIVSPNKDNNVNISHAKLLEDGFFTPRFVRELKCPYCKEILSATSIRSISIKLNPRNIGDVCVEFLCKKCSVGNTFYFSQEASGMQAFIDLLNDSKKPISEPIIEEEMYKQKYHNTVEYMVRNREI